MCPFAVQGAWVLKSMSFFSKQGASSVLPQAPREPQLLMARSDCQGHIILPVSLAILSSLPSVCPTSPTFLPCGHWGL